MSYVVSFADISELHSARGPELFFQREEVSKRLAGMVEVRQRVDDGNAGMRRQGVQGLLLKYTRDDPVYPARKTPRDVGDRFALAQPGVRMIEQNGRATHAHDAGFKRDARAQGRLFKNHREEPARKGVLVPLWVRLDVRGQTKQLADLRGVPLRAG